MWEFRRDPRTLSPEEQQNLEALFARLPRLRALYEFRVRFKEIVDTAADRGRALRELTGLFLEMQDFSEELDSLVRTFEEWEDEILSYFEAGQTSGPVEGINNKARVILKRAYGLRSADSLWTRLILDRDWAQDAALDTIAQIRGMVVSFRAAFACT